MADITRVYVALGSNIGNSFQNIKQAIRDIDNLKGCKVVEMAPIYITKPVGVLEQPDFLNTVIMVEAATPAKTLLNQFLTIENSLKRERTTHWGPRTIDIDILFYGQDIIEQKDLTVPHPRLHERDFVLRPMRDLAPDLIHPTIGMMIQDLYNQLQTDSSIEYDFEA